MDVVIVMLGEMTASRCDHSGGEGGVASLLSEKEDEWDDWCMNRVGPIDGCDGIMIGWG